MYGDVMSNVQLAGTKSQCSIDRGLTVTPSDNLAFIVENDIARHIPIGRSSSCSFSATTALERRMLCTSSTTARLCYEGVRRITRISLWIRCSRLCCHGHDGYEATNRKWSRRNSWCRVHKSWIEGFKLAKNLSWSIELDLIPEITMITFISSATFGWRYVRQL
jgi:hypothetical protein